MIINLKIVRVNSDYCDYLRKFDNKVAYNKNEKELRPFIGILFQIDACKYFAPLSSPKPKHKNMKNTLDFFKIKDGELGAVNFNNMIPVNENMEALLVSINGCIFAIPRGQLVQVPQSVYEVVQESLMKSLGAKAKIKVSNSEA